MPHLQFSQIEEALEEEVDKELEQYNIFNSTYQEKLRFLYLNKDEKRINKVNDFKLKGEILYSKSPLERTEECINNIKTDLQNSRIEISKSKIDEDEDEKIYFGIFCWNTIINPNR